MNIEYDKNRGCWLYNGKTQEEIETEQSQQFSPQDLEELGIVEDASQFLPKNQQEPNALAQIDEFMGYDVRPSGLEYEKLDAWDTTVDAAKAIGTEALHIFQPKDMESTYVERTHLAENMKYFYRYGAGALGFGKVGAVLKGVQGASKGAKALRGIGAFLNPQFYKGNNKVIKTLTAGIDNLGADIVSAFMLRRVEDEEGQFADVLGDNAPEWVKALQTNENDTELQERLKGTLGDTFVGILSAPVLSVAFDGLKGAFGRFVKSKGSKEAIQELDNATQKVEDVLDNSILIKNVDEAITKANEQNVGDVERFLLGQNFVNGENEANVLEIFKARQNGADIQVNEKGDIEISLNDWTKASEYSPEELAKHTKGDGVNLMNQSVKDTWTERGWLAEGEDIVTKTVDEKDPTKPPKVTTNTKATNRVVKNYKDKWQIDNNVKVEWVDGKVAGADGNTSATKYLGKNAKNTQGSIDKKKLQIAKLEQQLEKPNEIPNASGKKSKTKNLDESKEAVQYAYELLAQATGKTLSVLKRQLKGKNAEKLLQDISEIPDALDVEGIDPKYSKYFTFDKDQIGSENTQSVIQQALNIIRHGWTSTDDLGLDKALEDIYNEAVSIYNKTQDIDNVEAYIVKTAPEEYQEAMLSAIYKSINDNSGLDKRALLEEALRIAKNDLKHLEASANKTNLIPDILIQINKNCDNPYAVLRSELEHARDIAKGTVPNQKEKHFSRYNGINESEMSLEYVKKKADTRAGKTVEEPKAKEVVDDVTDDDLDWLDKQQAKETTVEEPKYSNLDNFINSDEIGEVSLRDLFADDDFYTKEGTFKDVADMKVSKMSAEDLDEYEKQGIYVESYLEFDNTGAIIGIKIHPKLTLEDVEFCIIHEVKHLEQFKLAQTDEKMAELFADLISKRGDYNAYHNHPLEKAADEQAYNTLAKKKGQNGQQGTSGVQQNQVNDFRNGKKINDGRQEQGRGLQDSNREGKQSISSEESGTEPTTSNKPISERIKETDGDLNQIDNIVNDVVNSDVKLSGTDWQAFAEDTDELYAKLKGVCGKNLASFKEAFANGDIDLVNYMTRKALAAERMISDLSTKAKELMNNGQDVSEIMQTIDYLVQYAQKMGSAYGRGLNEQKFIGKARSFFAITTLEKQGLKGLVDLLYTDLTSLNFTQSVKQNKAIMYEKIKNYFSGELWNNLMSDQRYAKDFDRALTKVISEKNPEAIGKAIEDLSRKAQKVELERILKYSTDTEALIKSIRLRKMGATYYVTNLLSSPRTQVKNIVSGVSNTFYFPMLKIVGGWMNNIAHHFNPNFDGNLDLHKEGLYTYQMLAQTKTWIEAGQMFMQCFKNGEGTMINLGREAKESSIEAPLDFVSWDVLKETKDPRQILANIFTLGCRFMGATDEFITQLNYRSVCKAKAMLEAERGADLLGLTGENRVKYMNEVTDDLFEKSFTVDGKPTNMEVYAEARESVLQTSLDGKYYNPETGRKEQVREVTTLMGISQKLQELTSSSLIAKIFFPFVRTNTNIAQMNLNHNAIYHSIASMVSPQHKELLMSDTIEGARMRAQIGMGIVSAGIGLGFAANGSITGAEPADSKTREALYKAGWKPYSIRIGNKWWSYQGYEPFQSILGFAADCFAIGQAYDTVQTNEESINSFVRLGTKAFFNNFIDKATFRDSIGNLNDLWEAIEREDQNALEGILARQTRGVLPLVSLGNYVSNQFGDTSPTKPRGFSESLFSRYFNDGLGDYRRNIWGERQDMYYNIISTGYEEKYEPEDLELLRLAQQGWSLSELQSKERKTSIDYKDYKGEGLNRSLFDRILETQSEITLEGKTLREAMREEILSEEYQRMLDGVVVEEQGTKYTKINSLKAIYKRYKDAAKEQVIQDYGEFYFNKNGRTIKEEQQLLREAQEAKLLEANIEEDLQNIRSFN